VGITDRIYEPGRRLAFKFADDSVLTLVSTNQSEPTHSADQYYTYSWYQFEFAATRELVAKLASERLVLFQSSLFETAAPAEGKPDKREQKRTMRNAACLLRDLGEPPAE
jgi:hypothetical protein